MRVLALDTSTAGGSVALVDDDRVIVECISDAARPQAERLPRDLLECLATAGVGVTDVDLFAVGAGPGSFTGLRVGIAAMQGLAVVTGRPMAAISILDAAAQVVAAARDPGTVVGVWLDAYRHEVFSALYAVTAADPFTPARLTTLDDPAVGRPDAVVSRWQSAAPAVVTGDGAARYASHLASLCPVAGRPPLAAAIGRLAVASAALRATVAPADVQPYYVRRPDVEVARERRHA